MIAKNTFCKFLKKEKIQTTLSHEVSEMAVTSIKPETGTPKLKTMIFVEQNNDWVALIAQKCEQPFLIGELHPLDRWLVIKLWKPVIWTSVAVLGN